MTELEAGPRVDAEAHAREEYPRESCGLLVVQNGKQRYLRCENKAPGREHFIMAPADYAAAEDQGEIVALVHSHPDAAATPSEYDRVVCEQSGLPWFIVSARQDAAGELVTTEWGSCLPVGYEAPLVGRTFAHGVLDCYSLIRDWYRLERGVALPDFDRTDEWWKRGGNLYLDNFEAAGFRRLGELEAMQRGDVFLAQIRSPVPNHGGIYLGDNLILHHMHGRLSSRDVWGGYIKENTVARLRYTREE